MPAIDVDGMKSADGKSSFARPVVYAGIFLLMCRACGNCHQAPCASCDCWLLQVAHMLLSSYSNEKASEMFRRLRTRFRRTTPSNDKQPNQHSITRSRANALMNGNINKSSGISLFKTSSWISSLSSRIWQNNNHNNTPNRKITKQKLCVSSDRGRFCHSFFSSCVSTSISFFHSFSLFLPLSIKWQFRLDYVINITEQVFFRSWRSIIPFGTINQCWLTVDWAKISKIDPARNAFGCVLSLLRVLSIMLHFNRVR